MPGTHAILSPSSAHRWLLCTAAPLYEAQFPRTTSKFAEEGTLAHSICELHVRRKFNGLTTRKFNSELKKLQQDPLYDPNMMESAAFYVEYLTTKANTYQSPPFVAAEEKVDLSEWIPGGYGTCDCVMIGGDALHITDYKNGKGAIVSAIRNPQMRLYALGALAKYQIIYGDTIKKVSMAIVQPRVTEDVSEDSLTVEELLAWGESIKPIAEEALSGKGKFCPGLEQCRFCAGKAQCAARAASMTELEQYKAATPEGRLTPEQATEAILSGGGVLTDAQIGDLLTRAEQLVTWYNDLKDYALAALLDGKTIPGYKAVEGRSARQFTSQDAALDVLHKAGYEDAIIYERKMKSLAQLEKTIGKKEFNTILGELVEKPRGAPTLVVESDKRPPYNAAASDFADIADLIHDQTPNE